MTVARRFIAGLLSRVPPGRSENRFSNVQTARPFGAQTASLNGDRPSGTGALSNPGTWVPGYDRPVPPGQKPFAHRKVAEHPYKVFMKSPTKRMISFGFKSSAKCPASRICTSARGSSLRYASPPATVNEVS
jgi:hypothetical protein